MTNVARENHPVWSLYDEERTARLNVYCLKAQIGALKRLNYFTETVIAIGSAGSIAGLSFWQKGVGVSIWTIIGAAAVLFKVVKPVFGWQKDIWQKQQLLVKYAQM